MPSTETIFDTAKLQEIINSFGATRGLHENMADLTDKQIVELWGKATLADLKAYILKDQLTRIATERDIQNKLWKAFWTSKAPSVDAYDAIEQSAKRESAVWSEVDNG